MNLGLYRLIFSKHLGTLVVASELTRAHSGSTRSRSLPHLPLPHLPLPQLGVLFAALAFAVPVAFANPTGAVVVNGQASFSNNGNSLIINNSPNAIINWQSFSIGTGELTRFNQQSAQSMVLNRVVTQNPSQILGSLQSNGQVFLINPNGILFGAGSRVDVGGLVASSLNLSNADFLAGRFSFSGGSQSSLSSVSNQGQIGTSSGGQVWLIGGEVENSGLITSPQGEVILAAGKSVDLTNTGTPNLSFTLNAQGNQAVNLGGIDAASANIFAGVIQQKGVINADSAVVGANGHVHLYAQQSVTLAPTSQISASGAGGGAIAILADKTQGQVNVDGSLIAQGGTIETSAATVHVADAARVNTLSSEGNTGTWLIDPTDYTVAASGGDMTGTALSNNLATTSITLQSSNGATSGSGNVNVNDAVSWSANTTLTLSAANNVNINQSISATSGKLALQYGQGAAASGNTGTYSVNAPVNLSAGQNFSTKLGSDGVTTSYTVITSLGAAGSITGTDLQGINGNLSGNYALGSNIDAAATSNWNGGGGFTPIGNASTAYTGSFAGLGHSIAALSINQPANDDVGLFGNVSATGILKDVGLIGGGVSGNQYVGALAGSNAGRISNSYATGSVSGAGAQIGGLVGLNNQGMISNSHANGNVSGGSSVGGLVGYNSFSTITNSYAAGNVTAGASSYNVGGLVGYNSYGGGTVSSSYATGNVSTGSGSNSAGGLVGLNNGMVSNGYATGNVSTGGGSFEIGGLVGQNHSTNGTTATVSNGYAAGLINASNSTGGLVGYNDGLVSNGYFNSSKNPGLYGIGVNPASPSNLGATGLTTAQMQIAANFVGFIFTPGASGWVMVDSNGTLNNAGGATGATLPMLASEYSTTIINAHQLQLMALNTAANYTLGQNIDATATGSNTDVWSSSGFVPVGNVTTPYTGTFAGQGHTIAGLTIHMPANNFIGLFGDVGGGGVVKDTGLVGVSMTGNTDVGALAGYVNYGAISDSYATGSVSGTSNVGGLIGYNNYGSVSNSDASSSVYGFNNAGGLIGYSNGSVSNSYASGSVSGNSDVGGLVGWNFNGTVSNSYFDSSLALPAIGAGTTTGAMAMSTVQMQTQASFTSAGWDFANTWVMYEGHTDPLLRAFLTPLTVTANNASSTYNAQGYTGNNGVTYSLPIPSLSGTLSYGGTSQGAVNVGSYTLNPAGLYSNQQGYLIGYVGGTLTITPAPLTVLNSTASNKTYDSTTAATLSGSLSGVMAADSANVSLNRLGTFASKNVGTGIAVTAAETLSGSGASNYTLTQPTGLSANITPASLTVANATASNKVYDGTTAVTLNGTLSGVIGGEAVTLNPSGSFASKNVGTAVAVTASDTLSGSAASNYTLTQPTGLSANITAKPITVSATGTDKVYDGGVNDAVTLSSSGLISGDTVNFADISATFADKNVGTAKAVTVSGISATGSGAGNYSVSNTTASTTANITQLASVTWSGGPTGNWSDAANWAGGALPDASNVAQVVIPSGRNVSYDSGTTYLTSLSSQGGLSVAAGTLNISGNLSTADYGQTGGNVSVNTFNITNSFSKSGGSLTATGSGSQVNQASGNLVLGSLTAPDLWLQAATGAISQTGSLTLSGRITAQAESGITLSDAGNQIGGFAGIVFGTGNIALTNTGGLHLGAILTHAGNLTVDNTGAVSTPDCATDCQALSSPFIQIAGSATLVAHSPLTIGSGGLYASGAVTLTAGQTSDSGDVLTTNGAVSGASLSFSAGDNLAVNGNLSASSGAVSLTSQAGNVAIASTSAINGSSVSISALQGTVSGAPAGAIVTQHDTAVSATLPTTVSQTTAEITQTAAVVVTTPTLVQSVTVTPATITSDTSSTKATVSAPTTTTESPTAALAASAGQLSYTPGASMSQMSELLTARHEFKSVLFKDALSTLGKDNTAADLQACKGAPTGSCMQTRKLATSPHPLRHPSLAYLPQVERKIALVIGINDYQGRIPKLSGAVPDAEAVAALLHDRMGYEVKVVKDATKADIVQSLNELVQEAEASDSVTIYYAGHGFLLESNHTGYWIPADGKINDPKNWLSNNDIARYLGGIAARQVALISDSCYSGSFAGTQKVDVHGLLDPKRVLDNRTVVVMSSGGEEPVADQGVEGHSIFAWNLMQSLKTVDQWAPGARVFDSVRDNVTRKFPQTPQYGESLAAGHQEGGDYLFEVRQY